MLITIGEASSDGFAAIKVTALGRPQILVCSKQLLTTTWYCEGIRSGGVSEVKGGGLFGYLLDFGKCILDSHCIRKCSVGTSVSRIRKEEEEAQCIQGKKGHLYMGQLGKGKCMGLRRGELSLS